MMRFSLWPCLGLLSFGTAQAAAPCATLAALHLPKVRVVSARAVAVGEPLLLWAGAQPTPSPKAFCRVQGEATPVAGSHIGFEVWLPAASDWNGKFTQAGNGGFAGSVPLSSLFDALQRGYASAATDGGHLSSDGLDASFGFGHPDRVVDFGWRAVRSTTLAAQRIVARAMGQAPRKAYFVGCSDGGRDALMVAQRFPQDFDGIVGGAPASHWTSLMAAGGLLHKQLAAAATPLPAIKLKALQAASLKACGSGASYVRDSFNCHVDPGALRCEGAENDTCLTPVQVDFVRHVYAGATDPATGQPLPGLEPGAEAEPGNWDFWVLGTPTNPLGGPASTRRIDESFYRWLVRGDPSFQIADLSEADIAQGHRRWSATLDATDPDLRIFRARGGKLLQYHGWTDAAIPPRFSIAYHDAVRQRLGGDTRDFHRLFMVPGMNHCGGGAGPWQVDWLGALEDWVERGQAPERLTARHPQTGEKQDLTPYALTPYAVTPYAVQPLPRPASGRIERLESVASVNVEPRHVDVWLPEGYSPAKRYAVLYMHDGQALFDASTTWNQQAWQADVAVARLVREGRIPDTIIVGIWNSGSQRYAEYYPDKFLALAPEALRREYLGRQMSGRVKADAYLRFVVNELKPMIDRRYATRPGPESTFIVGSSMGGLISMYAICEYPQVFGGAGGLSTHWVGLPTAWGPERLRQAGMPLAALNYLAKNLPDPATHRIWIDRGTDALDSLYAPTLALVAEQLRDRGFGTANAATPVFDGMGHSERDWAARLDSVLLFLMAGPAGAK